jgi:predicted DNA-binding ribbon-helix-helix protein
LEFNEMASQINALYERDFNRWIEVTIQQIQERRFQEVDWQHLLEELADMGKSEKRAFTSNLMVLLAHLLKLQVQADAPDSMKGSWYDSVVEHRARVKADLADNPSFKNFLDEAVKKAYKEARNLAIKQSKLAKLGIRQPSESEYPLECPFSCDQLLDDNFYG